MLATVAVTTMATGVTTAMACNPQQETPLLRWNCPSPRPTQQTKRLRERRARPRDVSPMVTVGPHTSWILARLRETQQGLETTSLHLPLPLCPLQLNPASTCARLPLIEVGLQVASHATAQVASHAAAQVASHAVAQVASRAAAQVVRATAPVSRGMAVAAVAAVDPGVAAATVREATVATDFGKAVRDVGHQETKPAADQQQLRKTVPMPVLVLMTLVPSTTMAWTWLQTRRPRQSLSQSVKHSVGLRCWNKWMLGPWRSQRR